VKPLVQFAGYQAVWFAAVIGAGHGLAWPGIAAAAVFVAWQLAASTQRGADATLAASGLVLGGLLDGAFAASGWLQYAAPWPLAMSAPAWILALWVAFALTFSRSLAFLQSRPGTAFALGAVFGPVAYLGAARGWNAVVFAAPDEVVLAALALGWGGATLGLALVARRLAKPAATVPA
jgi:hypothetical protein